jgi:hypothetical protein
MATLRRTDLPSGILLATYRHAAPQFVEEVQQEVHMVGGVRIGR